jgi:hypothetical protein
LTFDPIQYDVPLTFNPDTNKQTNPQTIFFHMTLLTVEGMIFLFCFLTKIQFIAFTSFLKESEQILLLVQKENQRAGSFLLKAV